MNYLLYFHWLENILAQAGIKFRPGEGGSIVIDYVKVNRNAIQEIEEMKVEIRMRPHAIRSKNIWIRNREREKRQDK